MLKKTDLVFLRLSYFSTLDDPSYLWSLPILAFFGGGLSPVDRFRFFDSSISLAREVPLVRRICIRSSHIRAECWRLQQCRHPKEYVVVTPRCILSWSITSPPPATRSFSFRSLPSGVTVFSKKVEIFATSLAVPLIDKCTLSSKSELSYRKNLW